MQLHLHRTLVHFNSISHFLHFWKTICTFEKIFVLLRIRFILLKQKNIIVCSIFCMVKTPVASETWPTLFFVQVSKFFVTKFVLLRKFILLRKNLHFWTCLFVFWRKIKRTQKNKTKAMYAASVAIEIGNYSTLTDYFTKNTFCLGTTNITSILCNGEMWSS